MAEVCTCPDVLTLERLVVGKVSPGEAETLEEHLAHCERCQACLTGLEVSDPLVERLHGGEAIAAQLPQGEVLEALMRRLRETSPASTGPADDTGGELPSEDETPILEPAPDFTDLLALPRGPGELGWLGPYRVIKVLGAGGMGVVFQAEDPQLQRCIALKVLNKNFAASALAQMRFQREARATAAVAHDHIVPIYHVGQENGLVFLAMPLLQGESLNDRLTREGRLPVAEAVRIAREAALGLAAAHDHNLVHRDIKPGNIWLESGGEVRGARVKILDFGLVHATNSAEVTQYGMVIGTPAYMAPEQARAETVDHRADLFSLGCVLYRMCTGEVPFKGRDTMSTLAALAVDRPRPPHELNPDVPPALSDLVMNLLARIPAERPSSAGAVVRALEAIERGEASAAPARPRRSLPRRLLWVAAGLLLILGPSVYLGQMVLRITTDKGDLLITTVDPNVEVTVRREGKVVEILDLKTKQKFELPVGEYEVALSEGAEGLRLLPSRFTVKRGQTEIVRVEWVAKAGGPGPGLKLGGPTPADALRREQISAYELKMAGDGDPGKAPAELVAILGDSRLKHWDWAKSIAFRPDDATLATCGPGILQLWDTNTGQLRRILSRQTATCGVFSPVGKMLAAASLDGTIRFWDPDSGQQLKTLSGHTEGLWSMAFSPDGKTLASAGGPNDKTIRLWDVGTGEAIHTFAALAALVAFSPDGKTLSAAGEHRVTRWDVATGKQIAKFGNLPTMEWPAFSPDGKMLASGRPGMVTVLDVATGREVHALPVPPPVQVRWAAFSPDGRLLAASTRQGPNEFNFVRVWDLATQKEMYSLPGYAPIFSHDGKTLAVTRLPGSIRLVNAATGRDRVPSHGHEGQVFSVAVSPDGHTLASAGWDQTVRLWDLATGKEQRSPLRGHWVGVHHVAYSPDGRTLASAGLDGAVIFWDPATGEQRRTLEGATSIVRTLAWTADGQALASAGEDGTVRLHDATTGQPRRTFAGHTAPVASLAFSPDSRTLASAALDETVRLWDFAAGRTKRTLKGRQVVFSPDGKQLATAVYSDNTVVLWDAATGDKLATLPVQTRTGSSLTSVAFAPDGRTLAAATTDGTVNLWDLAQPARARRTITLPGVIWGIAFTPEGRHLATANFNGTIYLLRLAEVQAAGKGPGKQAEK